MNVARQSEAFMDHRNLTADFNDVVKDGYIRLKRKKIGQWRKVYVVLRRASFRGPQRLEKYKTEKLSDLTLYGNKTGKVISLKDVEGIVRLPGDIREHALSINFMDGTYRMFACDSDFDVSEWENVLKQECLHPVEPKGSINGPTEIKDTFHVKLLPTPNLEVNGECLMQITNDSIHLYDINDKNKCLVSWPLNALRKYGRDETRFTFEAGRFCPTGEGIFIFRTVEGEQIHQKVHTATIAIATAVQMIQPHATITTSRSLPPVPVSPREQTIQYSRSQIEQHTFGESPPPPPPRPRVTSPSPVLTMSLPLPQINGSDNYSGDYTGSDYNSGADIDIDIPQEMAPSSPDHRPPHLPLSNTVPIIEPNNNIKRMISNGSGSIEEDSDVEYAEKYLMPTFRRYLQSRKQSDSEKHEES